MNYWTTLKKNAAPALLATLALGVTMLVTPPALVSQQGETTSGEHGDNPVVGSLPCEVAPELDVLFGGAPGGTNYTQVTLGLLGGSDLDSRIVDASGVPNGMLNRASRFTVFGLKDNGVLTLKRQDAFKLLVLLQAWLPDHFLGGTVSMISTIGNHSREIQQNKIDLPLGSLAAAPGAVVDARITIEPREQDLDSVVVYMSVVGDFIFISFTP